MSNSNENQKIDPPQESEEIAKENSFQAGMNKNMSTGKKASKKASDIPDNYYDFIRRVYQGKKINKEWKKTFSKYDISVDEAKEQRLLELALERDSDLRITLSLAELVLEGSEYSKNHIHLNSFIERLVSSYGSLRERGTKTIFQLWVDGSKDTSNKISFFSNQIANITMRSAEGNGESKLTPNRRNTLLCIAAIWLYNKNISDFGSLINYLSMSAFDVEGQEGQFLERNAFAFAASMISSTKKEQFSYFLSKISKDEKVLKSNISSQFFQITGLNDKLDLSNSKNEELVKALSDAEEKIVLMESEREQFKKEISAKEEKALHADIHHKDSKQDLLVKIRRTLEEDLIGAIKNAKTAISRIPADKKTEIADRKLNDAIKIIHREIEWLAEHYE